MQQLAAFHFLSVLCCGCNFSFRGSTVCSSEEEKACIRISLIHSQPRPQVGLNSPCAPLPLCPYCPPAPSPPSVPWHRPLSPPCWADPECWHPNTKHAGGKECVFMVVWWFIRVASQVVKVEKSILMSVFNRSQCWKFWLKCRKQ